VAGALSADVARLRARAESLAKALSQNLEAEAVDCVAAVGGGGAPGVQLPSAALSLPESYAAALRTGSPPVVGRLEGGRCLLDLRTVAPDEDELLLAAVRACSS
jgi:L-seryl-tRNA(Ser) seleniumtransferase